MDTCIGCHVPHLGVLFMVSIRDRHTDKEAHTVRNYNLQQIKVGKKMIPIIN